MARFVAMAVVVFTLWGVATAQTGADVDCSDQFNALAVCIAYVSSNDTTPPADCCSALLSVHLNHPVCLCQLLESAQGDPSATGGLNVTKALELPVLCKTGTDTKRCPALLGSPVGAPAPYSMGPMYAPVPEAGAPGVPVIGPPVGSPNVATPAVAGPDGSGATSIEASFAALVSAFILHFFF